MALPTYLAILTALPVLIFSVPVRAATHRVPSEYPTINAGLDVSVAGDTVLVAPGTYSDFEVRIVQGAQRAACAFLVDGVVLRSEQGPELTTIDMLGYVGTQPNAIYGTDLTSGATVVGGFTITGVQVGRAGVQINESQKVTFYECVLDDLDGSPGTGGIALLGGSDADVIDCRFTSCRKRAISQSDARLYVSGCTFVDCEIPIAVFGEPSDPPGELIVENSMFIGNSSPEGGGGAIVADYYAGGVRISGCYFQDHVSRLSGGALSIWAGGIGPLVVEDCIFWNNQVTNPGSGAGAVVAFGPGEITGCSFIGNQGPNSTGAGAIDLRDGLFEFHTNIIAATDNGVGVRLRSNATINNTCNVFWDNSDGDASGFDLDATDRVIDPEFCDPVVGDFTLRSTSPCLPGNSGGCGLIGPFGAGCGVISVSPESWGTIKARYRGTEPESR